jgi:hypothetical protein
VPTPTLAQVRVAKQEVLDRLRGLDGFLGAGVGCLEGCLVVRVSWRAVPPDVAGLDQIGEVTVVHQEVGDITAQPSDETGG